MADYAKICATCDRSFFREDGNMACGAGVNDARIAGMAMGDQNPIWAERKYSFTGIQKMLEAGTQNVEGFDSENMSPIDGRYCKIWARRKMTRHRLEQDYTRLPAAIEKVAEAWMSGTIEVPVRVEIRSLRDFFASRTEIPTSNEQPVRRDQHESFLRAAAEYLAPGWNIEIVQVVAQAPEILIGQYEGDLQNG